MKILLLTSILIPFLFVSFQKNEHKTTTRISGTVSDSLSGEGMPFVCIKFLLNDTLHGFGISDFDGYFRINYSGSIRNNDKTSLQFFYINDVFKTVILKNDSLTDLNIILKIHGKTTKTELDKWRDDFIKEHHLERWFYCGE
jgi:hypothetical protein